MFYKLIKIGIQFVLIIFTGNVFANIQYNPTQLQQFLQTNQCPGCDLSSEGFSGNHSDANLSNAILTNTGVNGCYTHSDISGANLSDSTWQANLSYVSFQNAILVNADFGGSNLEYTDFTGATVNGISLQDTDLFAAKITSQQLALATSVCGARLPDGTKGKCP